MTLFLVIRRVSINIFLLPAVQAVTHNLCAKIVKRGKSIGPAPTKVQLKIDGSVDSKNPTP